MTLDWTRKTLLFSDNAGSVTHNDCKELSPIEDGKPPANFEFSLSSKVETLLSDEKRSSGKAFIPVDSSWRVERAVRLFREDGKSPAGISPLPVIFNDCNPVRLPNSVGMIPGTAGNVSSLFIC